MNYSRNRPPGKGSRKKRCACWIANIDGDPSRPPGKLVHCNNQHPPSMRGGPTRKGEPHVDRICSRCGRVEVCK